MRFFLLVITTLGIAAGCTRGSSKPDPFVGLEAHSDLTALRHLAEVNDGGWYVDFGTPAQSKYTVGDWRSGWVGKGVDGDTTYAHVGMRGRVYFEADTQESLIARVRLRPHGTQALTPYLNNIQLKSIHLGKGEGFFDYDIELPKEHVQTGENYLLLTFGGTVAIEGQDVSVAVDSIWIRNHAEPSKTVRAPAYGGLVANVRLGDEEREAIALSRNSTLRYYVMVPADGSLGFGVGVEGEGDVPFAIEVTADGQPITQVLSGIASGAWADHKVDLSRFAGQTVRIELHARGEGAGRLGWNSLRILVPTPPERNLESAKNVIVLVIDTLRADKLRPFNAQTRVTTPAIDQFASDGVVFSLAQAPENWTKPSVASILTGLHPQTHQQKTADAALPSSAVLLSEHLKDQGFATGGFIANGYVSDRFGFDQGWDHYTNYIRESRNTEARTDVFRRGGRRGSRTHKDERFFVLHPDDRSARALRPARTSILEVYDPDHASYAGQVRNRV